MTTAEIEYWKRLERELADAVPPGKETVGWPTSPTWPEPVPILSCIVTLLTRGRLGGRRLNSYIQARRLPDAARAQHRPPARDLPAGHRSSRLTSNGTKPVCTTLETGLSGNIIGMAVVAGAVDFGASHASILTHQRAEIAALVGQRNQRSPSLARYGPARARGARKRSGGVRVPWRPRRPAPVGREEGTPPFEEGEAFDARSASWDPPGPGYAAPSDGAR